MANSDAVYDAPDRSAELAGLVDLERYPLFDLASDKGAALLSRCRRQLEEEGACVLPGFLLPEAVALARAELEPRISEAYYCEKQHNPYLDEDDPNYPQDHPRNRPQVSDLGALADDQIADGTVLRRLYLSPEVQAFVAALLGVAALYPYEDPLGSLNLNVFQPGQQLGWHYDNADWALTLMLQQAEAGGVYEYVPWVRSDTDENYDRVAKILDGTDDAVRRLSMAAGALVLFRGRKSIHRVTPVEGNRPRLIAVLSYDTQPGVMLTDYNRRLFYGRAN
ncbi:MAG: hypothetical protein R3316_00220 [Rhodovibrionaceae bacterium]|nr:hypothetical protein [Rhodovibrionaceae bacterium]